MEPDNPLLDRYILQQARCPNPVVCFLPTATGDSQSYIARFHKAFSKLPCRPRHLPLFPAHRSIWRRLSVHALSFSAYCHRQFPKLYRPFLRSFFHAAVPSTPSLSLLRPPPDLATVISECDIIYVGGGNTRDMLAVWRACGLDSLLRQAWENGTVLCGISAGAICWFEHGLTDSWGPLAPMPCLGFLPGSCTPHYDGEADRRPCLHKFVKEKKLPAGYALDDGAAIHFVGDKIARIVSSRPDARAYHVQLNGCEISEKLLPAEFLGNATPAC